MVSFHCDSPTIQSNDPTNTVRRKVNLYDERELIVEVFATLLLFRGCQGFGKAGTRVPEVRAEGDGELPFLAFDGKALL